MKVLKVAFCNRPEWNNPLGGDGVQMLKTKESLERLYTISIDIITDPDSLSNDYDIVHVFNYATYNITKRFIDKAKTLGCKVVTSSIYWDYSYSAGRIFNYFIGQSVPKWKAKIIRRIVSLSSMTLGQPYLVSKKFKSIVEEFIQKSDLILPNSKEEAQLLCNFIKNNSYLCKMRVVHNAANDNSTTYLEKDSFLKKYNLPDNYILQVGRIQWLKNQLNLLYALKDNPEIPIVFLGNSVEEGYSRKLRKLGKQRGNVYFINAVTHDEVATFYKYAKLHVLLSLRESPGLVSLEALVHHCPIVVATKEFAPVSTYFSHQKYVVDPFDLDRIKDTVTTAYKSPVFAAEDMSLFTWDYAAKQTMDAYCELFNTEYLKKN